MTIQKLKEDREPISVAKAKERAIDALRVAKAARSAAKKAEEAQKNELADKLNLEAEELENAARNWNRDDIDKEEPQKPINNEKDNKDKESEEETEAEAENKDALNKEDKANNSANNEEAESEEDETSDENSDKDDAKQPNLDNSKSENSEGNEDSSDDQDDNSEAEENNNDSSSSEEENDNSEDSDNDDIEDSDENGDDNSGESADSDSTNNENEDESNSDNEEDTDSEEASADSETENDNNTENDQEDDKGESDSDENDDNEDSSDNESDLEDEEEVEDSEEDEEDSRGSGSSSSSDSEDDEEDSDDADDSEDEEGEGEEEEEDDDPVKDIFQMSPQQLGVESDEKQKEPRDPTIDDIKEMLGTLKGEARRGAFDGLTELIKERSEPKKESLIEAFNNKGIREMTDDEFADGLNSVLDLIDQVEKPDYIDPKDKQARIDQIKQDLNDPATLKQLQKEDNVEIAKDFQKKKAKENEADKYRKYRALDQFKINFYSAIHDQVEDVKQIIKSYMGIDPVAEDEGIIAKGDIERYIPEEEIPIINFYFDCSGSWTSHPDAIEIGKQAVATVQEFADEGLIKLNILYFGRNSVNSNRMAVWGGGTDCWTQIIQNIKATNAKNVVLMTDCDMEYQAMYGPTCKVDGSVWFIWSLYDYAVGGREIPKHLIGRETNTQYSFGSGGYKVLRY